MKGEKDTLIARVKETIRQKRLMKRRECVLVGVSGGADSIALLLALLEVSGSLRLDVHVGHLHHGIRGRTADRDEKFVREISGSLGLPFHRGRADVPRAARRRKIGIEEAGRDLRYAFFLRTARRIGATRVALAHQADDQVETVLGNILRGTGMKGLCGMPYSRPLDADGNILIVRPLLDVTRKEVLRFLRIRRQGFVTDPTNCDNRYRRNRMRNELLPALRRRFNPQVDSAVLRLAGQAQAVQEVLDEALQKATRSVVLEQSEKRVVVNRARWLRKPKWIQGRLLRQAIEALGGGLARMGADATANLCGQLAAAGNGTHVRLVGKIFAVVDYARIIIQNGKAPTRTAARKPRHATAVAVPGTTKICRGAALTVRRRWAKGFDLPTFASEKSSREEVINASAVRGPLSVRPVRAGDAFCPLGAPGRVKVVDFFTNNKVPHSRRAGALVLVDDEGILWLMGHRLAHRARVGSGTRRLLLLNI
ncbi:MAG: tRNA lysidine(34) synthetase TilS [Planctomycetia bacterium]|nr:tRNA lysidine(34) synthetase TilS [Planctomycetia bacterium]